MCIFDRRRDAPSRAPSSCSRRILVSRGIHRALHVEVQAITRASMRTPSLARYQTVVTPKDFDADADAKSDMDVLHEIGSRIAAADPLHAVLSRVVQFVSSIVLCDSCFIYVLDEDTLVLRASKTPHPDVVDRLKLRLGQGITGRVAGHRQPVAVG